jgi:aminopeptidase N
MFPFYMGINETKYAWMDEGWATVGEWLISPMIDSSIVDDYGVSTYENFAGKETDVPITTLSTQQTGVAYYLNSYPKPAFGYLFLKDMLGEALFTKALHYYIRQWSGKHPMPYDFFNCINVGSGRNLNWFWRRWFFENGVPDLAISRISHRGSRYDITITSKGSKPVPIYLTVYFEDGTTQKIHRTIEVWEKANSTATVSFEAKMKVQKLTLGDPHVPDIDQSDNEYLLK